MKKIEIIKPLKKIISVKEKGMPNGRGFHE
jgi:hypothetical protein